MNPIISIIVPVFNAQTYLAQTIDSILAQTLSDFELILVNDGSTDSSAQIMADAVIKDARVRVLEQKNTGVSAARNRALDDVCGAYFTFVDADDVLDPDFLYALYQCVLNRKADIVRCGFVPFHQNETYMMNKQGQSQHLELTSVQALQDFFVGRIQPSIWGCLYHTQSFIDLRFPENISCAEDALYTYQCLLRVRSLHMIDDALYGYRQHGGSVMGSYKHQKIIDVLYVMQTIYTQAKLKPWFLELQSYLDVFLINHALNYRYPELLDAPYYDWAACDEIRQTLKQSFGMTKERLQKAMAAKLDFKTEMIFLGPEWLAKCLFSYKYKRRQAKLNKT